MEIIYFSSEDDRIWTKCMEVKGDSIGKLNIFRWKTYGSLFQSLSPSYQNEGITEQYLILKANISSATFILITPKDISKE